MNQKLILFGMPLLLAFGTGVGVAYHDGVMADDVAELSQDDVGSDVTVKGVVMSTDAECGHGDEKFSRDVGCFVMRDRNDQNRFIMVSTEEDLPELDATVVVRGELVFYWEMGDWEGWDWSGSWGDYGSSHQQGDVQVQQSGDWQDLKIAWVDAAGFAEPWLFK